MENTNQFFNLSSTEMLNLWKTILRLEPVRRDCTVERDDGIDIDALLQLHIRQWYAHLLNTAPVEWLPVEDVKAQVTLTLESGGKVSATVPAQCVRPVEWQLTAWQRPVTRFLAPDSHEAQVALDPYTGAGPCLPAAIDYGNRLLLLSIPADSQPALATATQPALATARCVVRPADGTFSFHPDALATATQPALATARCVVRPADGTFSFHPDALATIPHWHPDSLNHNLIFFG